MNPTEETMTDEKKEKWTKGPWRLAYDAQGPNMVMHPTEQGVAIASLTDCFRPNMGFHDPVVDNPEPCEDIPFRDCGKVTYYPERVANARLIAAAPELYEALNRIIAELPSRRDWLDPDLEKFARASLKKAHSWPKSQPKGQP